MKKQPSLSSETPQETQVTTQTTTYAMGIIMGQVAEVGGGNAEVMVEALGKDAKVPKI